MSVQTASLSWVSPPSGTSVTKHDLNPRIVQPNINVAIEKGLFKQVRYLIEFGARVNQRDHHGRTPLMNAALVEDEEWGVGLARLLLEKGARPYLKDAKGRNSVHYAVLYERVPLLQVYLSAIDFKIDDVDRNGNSILHYSAACGNSNMTSLLLDAYRHYGIDPNKVNSTGNTALLVACKMGQKTCAAAMAECDLVDTSICDKSGRSGEEWIEIAQHEESEDEETSRQLADRPNSVSSNRSMSTLNGYQTPINGGRHSRLGMYTPLGGNKHYLRRGNRRSHTGSMQRSVSRLSSGDSGEGLTSSRLAEHTREKEPKTVRFSDSTEKIHTILTNRGSHQIRTASPSDFRNEVQHVFHVSPFDCFNPDHNDRASRRLSSSSYQPSSASVTGQVPRNMISQNNPYNLHSWRGQVKQMFDAFNFQFSPSYRKGVIPEPEPDESDLPSCDTPSIRPPSGSSRVSNLESETASVASKPRSAGRRQSVALKAGIVGTLQVAADPRHRRPSICSNVSGISGKSRKAQNK